MVISRPQISDLIWGRIFENSSIMLFEKEKFFSIMSALEKLRSQADYNTGSIPASSAWALFATVCYFQPQLILEVGTFIGRSAVAMALGMSEIGVKNAEIHTCDSKNDIHLPAIENVKIVQYPRTNSYDMLNRIVSNTKDDRKCEMFHFDGNLQAPDFPLIERIRSADVIFALDDFEAVDKGVTNYVNLRDAGLLENYQLILPPTDRLLQRFGFSDRSATALLIPLSTIQLSQ